MIRKNQCRKFLVLLRFLLESDENTIPITFSSFSYNGTQIYSRSLRVLLKELEESGVLQIAKTKRVPLNQKGGKKTFYSSKSVIKVNRKRLNKYARDYWKANVSHRGDVV